MRLICNIFRDFATRVRHQYVRAAARRRTAARQQLQDGKRQVLPTLYPREAAVNAHF